MNKMNSETRTDVNDAAVMQTISQNQCIRDYCKSHNPPVSFSEITDAYEKGIIKPDPKEPDQKADMEILRDYVKSNSGAGDYQIRDYHSFGEGKGHSVLVSNGKNTYVAFDGTGKNGWIDNGEGLCGIKTDLQEQACDRFDYYATNPEFADIMTEDNNIVITGHSKGGNKAMYTTMNSEYGNLIDGCVSLDGQGFSPEAIDYMKELYGDSGEYQDRVNKIISVSGQNDFVNELGISIVNPENKYVVDYKEINAIARIPLGLDGTKETIASFHSHRYLFNQVINPFTGEVTYTSSLNKDANPGPIHAVLNDFMSQYMKLSQEERQASAPAVMNIFQKAFGGDAKSITVADIDGIMTALLQTSEGNVLMLSLAGILKYISPLLSVAVAAYCAILLSKILSGKLNGSTVEHYISNTPKEIMLNEELFMEMNSSFDEAFSKAKEAAQHARQAEKIKYESQVCDALVNNIDKRSEDIKEIMRIVVESFSSVDKENAKAARAIGESYLGTEMYSTVIPPIQTPPELAEQGIYYR